MEIIDGFVSGYNKIIDSLSLSFIAVCVLLYFRTDENDAVTLIVNKEKKVYSALHIKGDEEMVTARKGLIMMTIMIAEKRKKSFIV